MSEVEELGSGPMFDAIAHRYDLLNRILSMGIDQGWRRRTIEALDLGPNPELLDVAVGTGDLSLVAAQMHRDATIVGIDPSPRMLAIGRTKLAAHGISGRVSLIEGDARALPFVDGRFDAATIAFGIRNVPDRLEGLREMARVTRPGGRVAVLELGEPEGGVLGPLARFHIRQVVPRVGGFLSGSREYRYLQQSVAAFPPPAAFASLMEEAGLRILEVTPLTLGVVNLYLAEVREGAPR